MLGLPLDLDVAQHVQLLRYSPGQFYAPHHDQNAPRASAWGPRACVDRLQQ